MRSLVDVSSDILRETPYAFVSDADRLPLKDWVDSGGLAKEVDSLSDEQRYVED